MVSIVLYAGLAVVMATVASFALFNMYDASDSINQSLDETSRLEIAVNVLATRLRTGQGLIGLPVGSVGDDGYYVLPDLGVSTQTPDGTDFVYCPFAPRTGSIAGVTTNTIEIPDGSSNYEVNTVSIDESGNDYIVSVVTGASYFDHLEAIPSDILAAVIAPRENEAPRCNDLQINQGGAYSVDGGRVATVDFDSGVGDQFAAATAEAHYYVGLTGSGGGELYGYVPAQPMTMDEALQDWGAKQPRVATIHFTEDSTLSVPYMLSLFGVDGTYDSSVGRKTLVFDANGHDVYFYWPDNAALPADVRFDDVHLVAAGSMVVPSGGSLRAGVREMVGEILVERGASLLLTLPDGGITGCAPVGTVIARKQSSVTFSAENTGGGCFEIASITAEPKSQIRFKLDTSEQTTIADMTLDGASFLASSAAESCNANADVSLDFIGDVSAQDSMLSFQGACIGHETSTAGTSSINLQASQWHGDTFREESQETYPITLGNGSAFHVKEMVSSGWFTYFFVRANTGSKIFVENMSFPNFGVAILDGAAAYFALDPDSGESGTHFRTMTSQFWSGGFMLGDDSLGLFVDHEGATTPSGKAQFVGGVKVMDEVSYALYSASALGNLRLPDVYNSASEDWKPGWETLITDAGYAGGQMSSCTDLTGLNVVSDIEARTKLECLEAWIEALADAALVRENTSFVPASYDDIGGL